MLLPKFQYHEPKSIREACGLITELKGPCALLAGGTDLVVNLKKRIVQPENLIDLSRISELKTIQKQGKQYRIGSGVTAAEISASIEIRKNFRALAMAAESLGSPLVRNLATIGGNIVNSRPAADFPPALIAYGAKLRLVREGGERSPDVEAFIKGPGRTELAADELAAEILLDAPLPYTGSAYLKLGIRKALEISIVNLAVVLTLEKPNGSIRGARIVMGAVGPTPLRAITAEKLLLGAKPGEALFAKAGEAAAGDAKPIDDFRGSAAYRRDIVKVFTRRALAAAWQDAKAKV
ncbi:MAG: xanthine dehydrogenase family protein subunit M [Desulfobacteraceae bacterium]|nr:MAG: xanthine dehydrogenase family protein subunit M [Desulfobacteraceae bacterium]